MRKYAAEGLVQEIIKYNFRVTTNGTMFIPRFTKSVKFFNILESQRNHADLMGTVSCHVQGKEAKGVCFKKGKHRNKIWALKGKKWQRNETFSGKSGTVYISTPSKTKQYRFFLAFMLDSEDAGSSFLRNVSELLQDYVSLDSRRQCCSILWNL